MKAFLLSTLVCLGATGCGNCLGLAEKVSPAEVTLRVSESITLHRERGGTCGYPVSPVATSWFTSDTLIVQLDTVSGVVTGRSPGTAHVTARDAGIDAVIHVQP
jgi:hypothetical protein